jgi:hypothetical protein
MIVGDRATEVLLVRIANALSSFNGIKDNRLLTTCAVRVNLPTNSSAETGWRSAELLHKRAQVIFLMTNYLLIFRVTWAKKCFPFCRFSWYSANVCVARIELEIWRVNYQFLPLHVPVLYTLLSAPL